MRFLWCAQRVHTNPRPIASRDGSAHVYLPKIRLRTATRTTTDSVATQYYICSSKILFTSTEKHEKSESARRLENAERGTLSRPTTNKRDTRCIIIQLLPAAKATQQLTAHSNARTRSTMPSSPVAPSGMMMDRESAYRECSVCNEHKKIFAQGKCKVCWSKVRLRAPVYPLNP